MPLVLAFDKRARARIAALVCVVVGVFMVGLLVGEEGDVAVDLRLVRVVGLKRAKKYVSDEGFDNRSYCAHVIPVW